MHVLLKRLKCSVCATPSLFCRASLFDDSSTLQSSPGFVLHRSAYASDMVKV